MRKNWHFCCLYWRAIIYCSVCWIFARDPFLLLEIELFWWRWVGRLFRWWKIDDDEEECSFRCLVWRAIVYSSVSGGFVSWWLCIQKERIQNWDDPWSIKHKIETLTSSSMGNGISSGHVSQANLGDDNADERRAKQQKVATSNESQSNRVVTKKHTIPERSRTRKVCNISDVAVSRSVPRVCHLVKMFSSFMPRILTFFDLL